MSEIQVFFTDLAKYDFTFLPDISKSIYSHKTERVLEEKILY